MRLFSLLFLLFLGCATAKITSSNFLTLSNYTSGAFVFFYSNQIVVGINIWNGLTTGESPYISFYSLEGKLQQTFDLPVSCSSLYCNSDMTFISLQGSVLSLLVFPDEIAEYYQFMSIDLDKLKVVSQHPPPRFYINDFLPAINSTTVVFNVNPGTNTNTFFGTFDIPSLTPSVPQPSNYPYVIPGNTIVLPKLMFICASEAYAPYDYDFIPVSLPSLTFGTDTELACDGFAKYDSSQNQIAWINGSDRTDIVMQFYSVSSSNTLKLDPAVVTVGAGAYPTDFAISPNYAFVAGRLWQDQSAGYIYQVATKKGKATLLDSTLIPNDYLVGGFAISDYNSAIDEESGTYVVLAAGPWSNYPPALFILNFDGN